MLSTLAGWVQVITILVGATFGVLGVLSKREGAVFKKSDKIALVGIVVACALALTAFAIDAARKARQRDSELQQVAAEVARQSKLLSEVQRGLQSIQDFSVGVDFTVSAAHPKLSDLIQQWDSYLAGLQPSDLDERGYSRDGAAFVARDERGRFAQLYVDPDSRLFPAHRSSAHRLLLPVLSLAVLKPGAPEAEAIRPHFSALPTEHPEVDLALFMPLSNVNYVSPSTSQGMGQSGSRTFARLIYDPRQQRVTVSSSVNAATPVVDTGAVVGLQDLPGRQLVVTGLGADTVTGIPTFKFTAQTGKSRFWSGHKQVLGKEVRTFVLNGGVYAAYTLRESDFSGLIARVREKSAETIPAPPPQR